MPFFSQLPPVAALQVFIAFLPVTLKARKRTHFQRLRKLATLGDHVRARRLDRGLFQRDVGKLVGVDAFTVLNWEKHKSGPEVRSLPKIMDFLGYCPAVPRPTFPEKLYAHRTILLGLTHKELAKQLDVDEGTLLRWEHGDRCPRGDKRAIIERVRRLSER